MAYNPSIVIKVNVLLENKIENIEKNHKPLGHSFYDIIYHLSIASKINSSNFKLQ